VLLITLDTTRADHLGCYGHPRVKTPHLDQLAQEGVRFDQCVSSAPITLPSHASILTGTEPYVHGIRANSAVPLADGNETLAETLKKHGFRTGAQVAAYVLHEKWGLSQGFDDYKSVEVPYGDEPVPDEGGGVAAITRREIFAERRGDAVREDAVRWLKDHQSERFFLWVHFFDPHRPYDPPEPFRSAYSEPYEGEVAFMDAQVGELLDALESLGLNRDTLVVAVGDHGEGLGEHDEPSHLLFVYDTTVRVPLIMHCPDLLPAGRVVDSQVRTIDIVPTVLDVLGLPPKADTQGVSLMPLIRGDGQGADLDGYSETFVPFFVFGYSPARAFRRGGWKYIHVPQPELYHVAEDPGETRNLADSEPQRLKDMRDGLYELLAAAPPSVPLTQPAESLSEAEVHQLAALGYVALSPDEVGDPGLDDLENFEPTGPDAKDHKKEIELLGECIGQMHARQFADAEGCFERLYTAGADNPIIVRWYVEALTEQNKLEPAIELFERAVEQKPDFSAAWNDLGLMLHRLGRDEEAVEKYREAVRLAPDASFYRTNLGNALVAIGRLDEAEEQFRIVSIKEPDTADAWNGLGNVFSDRGDLHQAADMYERAIFLNPKVPHFYYNLGRVRYLQERYEEALQAYGRALAIRPDYANAYWNIGNALLRLGRIDDAIDAYAHMLRLDPGKAPIAIELGVLLAGRHDERRAIDMFRRVIQYAPGNVTAANNLAWLLATASDASLRNGEEALRLAEKLVEQAKPRHPGLLDTLAAARAEAGQFERAAEAMQEAISLLDENTPAEEVQAMKARLELYRDHQPYHETGTETPSG
jgi:arylsulfatase A-like enzyme/Flp pilus assembly protein TadD